jgi:hypothetical protein
MKKDTRNYGKFDRRFGFAAGGPIPDLSVAGKLIPDATMAANIIPDRSVAGKLIPDLTMGGSLRPANRRRDFTPG